jgi:hypothetical protein
LGRGPLYVVALTNYLVSRGSQANVSGMWSWHKFRQADMPQIFEIWC